ncbi:hypothetical protein HMPREF1981_01883 [Bacteroides pyogenes F0041]|uniref:Uncharacterized protein n=1 Tax=Bacteroides pyogenes F0041 TaxID=1321819 RepID=U2DZG1_9BACE|nr:hypothetical protein HMPREF1981_01883 [Bacteroides pyogenes F0041]
MRRYAKIAAYSRKTTMLYRFRRIVSRYGKHGEREKFPTGETKVSIRGK